MIRLGLVLIMISVAGCTYNASFICGSDNTPTVSPLKTTEMSPELQGNVPVQGGAVNNPTQTAR